MAGGTVVAIHAPDTVLIVLIWVMLGAFGLMLAALAVWGLVIWREVHLGYTTLEGQFRHLQQLDPRTGEVIRTAGSPYPSKNRRSRID